MKRERIYREFVVRLKEEGEFAEVFTKRGWIDVTSVESFYFDDDDTIVLETETGHWAVENTIEEVLEKTCLTHSNSTEI